jgi:protein SCO1/2
MKISRTAWAGIAACVILIAAGLLGAAAWRDHQGVAEPLAIGGPFTLASADGPVTDKDFRGRWMLIYFGYTHCPDACPTTLNDMATTLDKLPKANRDHVVPLFITVDPDRDTPAIIGDYAKAFGPQFIGLSGTQAQVTQAEHAYRVYAAKHPLKGQDYAVDHSSVLYLMKPDGSFSSVFTESESPADMAQRLLKLGV